MPRIEWVKLRLNNWALWKSRESAGGLGFKSQATFLNDASTDRYRESIIPTDEVEAAQTNTAVESLRQSQPHLYSVVTCYYLSKSAGSVRATARQLGKAESTIAANLDSIDVALRTWFSVQEEKKKTLYT